MKKKRFFGQVGFTLVEVLVASALLGVLSLAVINQMQLVSTSKREANEDAIINGITDRLATELSRRATCNANFKNKTITTATPGLAIASLIDSESSVIIATSGVPSFKGKIISGVSVSAANVDSVQVDTIYARQNPADLNEMLLTVNFKKKRGIVASFVPAAKIELPLTIIQTGGVISECYNDITNSIASAIRLSCRGNTAYYNPLLNTPFGACERTVQATSCPAGKFLKKIYYGSNQIKYDCFALQSACGANQFITGFNTDGSVSCGYPLPNCAAGQMMIMNSAGKYICLNTNTGCSGLYAVKSFNADGTVTCSQFYPLRTCAGLVTNIGPAGITCSANVIPITCPTGQFVSNMSSTGVPSCSPFITYPYNCPANQAAYGVDASGNLLCQTMTRKLSCGGGVSPGGLTFLNCQGDGGTVMNRDGGTNSFCQFNAASCPGGYTQCQNYRYTTDTQCTDSNSACSYSVQTRYLSGSNVFTTPVTPGTVSCYYWARNSGPWVYSCSQYAGPTGTTPVVQVGCY
ncbi:MAG: prepilin-type N-terminal cleavage/methylation domain-containing protein [Bacteriovorax sp.]|nr:prepilin-type N-terminal cleavage/methylation domain-containing protein [Bacteriovorax sp.]